ncbi:Zinc finger, RING-CH-type [Sesbania bispinosa]|nr:Zinc finger, RING-CH-type [Sesbania bispinosa]
MAKEEVSDDGSSSVETGDLESHPRLSLEKETGLASCRVCQCAESDKRGDAALEFLGITPVIESDGKGVQKDMSLHKNIENKSGVVEFVGPDGEVFICKNDLEIGLSHQDALLELGCCCKNDLALVHYACALKWFVNHGSTICEICGHIANNIRVSDFNKVVGSLKEYEALRERTATGDPGPAQAHANNGVDPDAVAAIRRQRLSEIALWFCPHNSSSITNNSNVDTVSQVVSEQPLNIVPEDAGPEQNPATKWAVEGTGILLATGLLTITLAWLIAPRVGKKTAKSGLHILLGGVCALTVVIFFRFFVLTRIKYGPARYWAILFVFWFLVFGIWASRTHGAHTTCSATLSVVPELEEKQVFDGEKAALLVKELRKSFDSGKTKSYEWRISQLEGIAKMLEEKEKEITIALDKDLSKPGLEAFITEISQAKSSCSEAIQELKHWMKPEKVNTSITTFPSSAEIVSEPLGVVLVISTWNFPFLLSMDPVIGAISAGNAVVLKPSEISPATSSLLANLLENYLDNSAIRVVEGAIPETTALLEQKWDKILYTGSARVGRIVMAAAAKHLTPVVLELGGKCPAVVDSDVNLQVTARRIIGGKWACNSGQACISVDYIITRKEFAPSLINALKEELEQCFGKDLMESKDMSRIVSPTQFARLVKLLDEDKVSDKIVLGGQRDEKKLKIAPTILLDVPEEAMVMQEEIFGPILPIITVSTRSQQQTSSGHSFVPIQLLCKNHLTVDNIEDCFSIIKSKPKPLAAYLFTNNEQLKKDYVEKISSGGMLINDTVIHVATRGLPFGGVEESGMGSYHGKFSFDSFSHKKSVLYRSFDADSSLRYPPYTPKKEKLLKAVISGNIFQIISALFGWS